MKKTYIQPEIEVIQLDVVEMIAISIPIEEEKPADGSDGLTNKRRGKWGNLWAEMD